MIAENDLTTRVYVASAFRNYAEVREFWQILRELGCIVSYDWTLTDEFDENGDPNLPDDGLSDEQKETYAFLDKRGVRTADVVITLADTGMKGAHWEGGLADAYGIPHIVVDPKEDNIFYGNTKNVIVVPDKEAALNLVTALPADQII